MELRSVSIVNLNQPNTNIVTATASDASATETGPTTGTFTLNRTGSTSAALTVNYAVGGTATSGDDYTALGTTVTFGSGSDTATLTVTPVNDSLIEPNETVTLTLASGSGYTVGNPASATVTITSDDANTVSIAATDASASEAGPDPGTFTFTRTGDNSAALIVNYTVGGTATSGSDYNALGTAVTIPIGSYTAFKTVNPVNDSLIEADETVDLTLGSGTGYTVGTPASATVTIISDDVTSYLVTVTKSGTGTVTSTPTGINCGKTCKYSFTSGTDVTLTASAGSGYQFTGWSGDCINSSGSCTVTMTGPKNVMATFKPLYYKLSLTKSGFQYGIVTSAPAGINCGNKCSKASANFATDSEVVLTATANTGRSFLNWTGACLGSLPTCTVKMDSAKSVGAVFK